LVYDALVLCAAPYVGVRTLRHARDLHGLQRLFDAHALSRPDADRLTLGRSVCDCGCQRVAFAGGFRFRRRLRNTASDFDAYARTDRDADFCTDRDADSTSLGDSVANRNAISRRECVGYGDESSRRQ
jgi:hypothetical protein